MGKGRRKKGNKYIAAMVIVVLTIMTVFLVAVCYHGKRQSTDLSKYVNYKFVGLNGKGTIVCELDEKTLSEKLTKDEKNAVLVRRIEALVSDMSVTSSKIQDLTNGEAVEIKIEFDKDRADKLNCKLKNNTFIVMVEGLEDKTALDIFSNVDVVVAGISPNAYANVVNKWQEESLKNISFSLDKSTNIRIGDVLTVTCDADDESLLQAGMAIVSKTKTFKVDKIDAYVENVDELDIPSIKRLSDKCVEIISQETEDMTFRMLYKASKDSAYLFQYNNEWVNSTELLSAKMLSKKNPQDEGMQNYVFLFFKANISNGVSDVDVYFAFEFSPVIKMSDGNFKVGEIDLKGKYLCGMDYNTLYGQVVLSKENSYNIFDVDGVKRIE